MLIQENAGLVIVDVQGKLARIVHESKALLNNIEILIQGCQILKVPIIWLEQNPAGLGRTASELRELLEGYHPLEKNTFNACDNRGVMDTIAESGAVQWLVCGIEAHVCVYQTSIGLLSRGYEVEVVADCISSRSEANKELALKKLQDRGAGLTSVEMCLFELLKDARSEEFRKILPLIR